MKFVCAAVMLVCLVGMFFATVSGYTWIADGHGLHPVVVLACLMVFVYVGVRMSIYLDELE